jgi:hypothetical protein
MSAVVIAGDTSGSITLDAPAVAGTTVLTLPATAGTVFVGGQALTATTGSFSGNVTLGSSVLATPSGSAPSYTCRAWINFNGKGTVAIRASGNVSSLTDSGTGNYLINFTNAMPDINYAAVGNARFEPTGGGVDFTGAIALADPATTSVRAWVSDGASPNTAEDEALISVTIFR